MTQMHASSIWVKTLRCKFFLLAQLKSLSYTEGFYYLEAANTPDSVRLRRGNHYS